VFWTASFCRIVKHTGKIILSREKLEKSTLFSLLSICVTRKFNKHSITKHRHALKKKENIERGFKQVVCVASFNDLRFIVVSPLMWCYFPVPQIYCTFLDICSKSKNTQETLPPPLVAPVPPRPSSLPPLNNNTLRSLPHRKPLSLIFLFTIRILGVCKCLVLSRKRDSVKLVIRSVLVSGHVLVHGISIAPKPV
jgi:hypothetical protein